MQQESSQQSWEPAEGEAVAAAIRRGSIARACDAPQHKITGGADPLVNKCADELKKYKKPVSTQKKSLVFLVVRKKQVR